ncbi:MAG: nucleotidyltransferase family protein [Paludibacteraceae bacterium]|nr:nucleotidyltransferase family protein [Paludibacteraceae bacterium]
MNNHFIFKGVTLLDALSQINSLRNAPLVLFVVDEENRMVGTLTDGDSRRALISGFTVDDKVEKVMHKNFKYLLADDVNDVQKIKNQKNMLMKLVPVLNKEMQVVDVIDLQKYITRLPVDAVLMAGGKGERLRPLTENTPKPLLLVGNKAIIDHNVDRLISYGIKHISVTVNYLKEQIEEHYSEERNGVKINCCREPKYLGTMGSIKFVEKFYNDAVLVMNSDLFTNIDYEDFYLHFVENNADMSVAAIPYNISIPYGILELDGRDIKGLVEKPQYNYYANAGIYLFKRHILKEIPDNVFFNATDLIEKLIAENKKVIRYPLNGTWIDIGNPQEYQKANDLVKHW